MAMLRNEKVRPDLDINEILVAMGSKFIDEGAFRAVYSLGNDLVVKVAKLDYHGCRTDGIRDNMAEMALWNNISRGKCYHKMRRWLAPCHNISFGGIALIQQRTTPCPQHLLPKRVPHWITDIKSSNGGLLNGKFVFHDYAFTLMFNDAVDNHKLVPTTIDSDGYWFKLS